MEDQSAPIPERKQASLGGSFLTSFDARNRGSTRPHYLGVDMNELGGSIDSCAHATRGLGRPSVDTRSGRPSSPPSREKIEERWSLNARSGDHASRLAECEVRVKS